MINVIQNHFINGVGAINAMISTEVIQDVIVQMGALIVPQMMN